MALLHARRDARRSPRARAQGLDTPDSREFSNELRDGLLQDLVALSMLTTALRGRLDDADAAPDVVPLLETLSGSLDRDLDRLRAMISRLEQAA
jgi:hypothetical protein